MIRDPSDGTVRSQVAVPPVSAGAMPGSAPGMSSPVLETKTSGLPISKAKAEYLERLAKSREWLKQYFEPKESTDDAR